MFVYDIYQNIYKTLKLDMMQNSEEFERMESFKLVFMIMKFGCSFLL